MFSWSRYVMCPHQLFKERRKIQLPFSWNRRWSRTLMTLLTHMATKLNISKGSRTWKCTNDWRLMMVFCEVSFTCILGLDGNMCEVRSVRAIMLCEICIILFLDLKGRHRKRNLKRRQDCVYILKYYNWIIVSWV